MGFSIREFCFVNSRKACVPALEKWLVKKSLAVPRPAGEASDVRVHMLLSERGWAMSLLAMCQFERRTGRPWKFILHDDGTLKPGSAAKLRERFPDCRIIFRSYADPIILGSLERYPRLRSMRDTLCLA